MNLKREIVQFPKLSIYNFRNKTGNSALDSELMSSYNKALDYIKINADDQAVAELYKVLTRKADFVEGLTLLGYCFALQGKTRLASKCLSKATEYAEFPIRAFLLLNNINSGNKSFTSSTDSHGETGGFSSPTIHSSLIMSSSPNAYDPLIARKAQESYGLSKSDMQKEHANKSGQDERAEMTRDQFEKKYSIKPKTRILKLIREKVFSHKIFVNTPLGPKKPKQMNLFEDENTVPDTFTGANYTKKHNFYAGGRSSDDWDNKSYDSDNDEKGSFISKIGFKYKKYFSKKRDPDYSIRLGGIENSSKGRLGTIIIGIMVVMIVGYILYYLISS